MEEKQFRAQFTHAYTLHNTPGLGNRLLWRLTHSSDGIKDFLELDEAAVEKIIGKKYAVSMARYRDRTDSEKCLKDLEHRGIAFYPYFHPCFPQKLLEIPDPPWAVYAIGALPAPSRPAVAVIGARQCSEYGRYMARQFGEKLARAGVQVISGMARGVDGIAQKGALSAGGLSIAVLGCGADICYPEENKELYDILVKRGGLISEYPPGTMPRANLFPARNRLISGLSDAVLVIEAKEKSGTLITVDMALEQGRDIYALPGRVTDPLSRGCNRLIKQGAGAALSPEDLLEEMKVPIPASAEPSKRAGGLCLSAEEKELYMKLELEPKSLQAVYEEYGGKIPIQDLAGKLLTLCLKGAAVHTGGSSFARRELSD